MTPAEAKAVILAQIDPDDGTGEPQTFLGGLRPYRGRLPRRQFHNMMAALRVLGHSLGAGGTVDRELVSALWSLTELTRLWALEEDGMLRRNKLISDADLAVLRRWHGMLAYAVMILLESDNEQGAFHEYDLYTREAAVQGEWR